MGGKNLDLTNIIRKVFDDTTDSLRITGSLSVSAPAGGATEAKQDTQITELNSINNKLPSNLTVTANRLQVELPPGGTGLTNTELRAVPVAVSATNLNIRGLTFSSDKVDATGSSVAVSNFPSGLATQLEQTNQTTQLSTLNSTATNINNNVGYSLPKLDVISQKSILNITQVSSLIDSSLTPIPFASTVTVFTSVNANIYKFQTMDDIGEYMALCVGAVGSEATVAALALGGGEVSVYVAAGSRVSVRSLSGVNIINGKLIINALGLGQQ